MTVGLFADEAFVKNVDIVNSQGYALNARGDYDAYIDDVHVYNNGLNIMFTGEEARAHVSNCKFGFIYDAAKQTISIGSDAKLYLNGCHFEKDNFDPEIFVNGTFTSYTDIYIEDCTFIATSTGAHPAPFNGNGWAVINLATTHNSGLGSILIQRCNLTDYAKGIITKRDDEASNVVNMDSIFIDNCLVYSGCLAQEMRNINWNDMLVQNSIFNGRAVLTSASSWFKATDASTIKNCKIMNDNTTKIFAISQVVDTEFNTCQNTLFYEASSGIRCTFIESKVQADPFFDNGGYLRLTDSYIQNSQLTSGANIDNIIIAKPAPGGTLDFTIIDGTLKAVAYNYNFNTYYYIIAQTVSGNLEGLYGDDWQIPIFSREESIRTTTTAN